MTEPSPILYERRDKVALITLNRPDNLNALTLPMVQLLVVELERASNDHAVGAIVLTGNGKAFCAGVDLKELSIGGGLLDVGPVIPTAFNACSKPVIAAINGFAITGGLELALACDFLYASDTAKFGDTHAKVGLMPAWGLSQKLPRLVGVNRALELSLSGRLFSADDALKWGMINAVLAAEDLLDEALKTAAAIADNDTTAVEGIRGLILDGWKMSLQEGLDLEQARSNPHNDAVDFAGMQAQLDKVRKG